MKRSNIALAGMLLLLAGCAHSLPLPTEPAPYGFLGGFWHGLIIFFSFVGSLFNDDIAIYAINNNGGWYDFGFYLGIITMAGSARASK